VSPVVDYKRHQIYSQEIPHMQPDPWRLVVRLKSRRALVEYAEFHKLSGRALARKADAIAKKKDKNRGVGPGIVGHLMSGRRTSCSLATAQAIEEALGCPTGFLFEPSLSSVSYSSGQKVPA
jgi:hypothetical protein